jgi:hypothetical protein
MMPKPNWPEPPLIEQLFLEDQVFYLAAGLIVVGIVMYVIGGRHEMPGLRRATAAPVIGALLAATVASVYDTEREKMTMATHELVHVAATRSLDAGDMSYWFSPQFTLSSQDDHLNRDKVLKMLKLRSQFDNIDIKDAYVQEVIAHQPPGAAGYGQTYLVVAITSDLGPSKTRWILNWELSNDQQWKLTNAELQSINGQEAPSIRSLFR